MKDGIEFLSLEPVRDLWTFKQLLTWKMPNEFKNV
jgi:hypothetical protein